MIKTENELVGYVYLLKCNKTGLQYIGSTTNKVKARIQAHKDKYKQYCIGKYNYVSSFKIIENDDYTFETLAEVKCIDKTILKKVEQEYISRCECVNMLKAFMDRKAYSKEYHKLHRAKRLAYFKQWREKQKKN